MTDDRIRMGVIVEGGAAPEWYWRQQIEAIEQERDRLKAKLAEVEAERDRQKKIALSDKERFEALQRRSHLIEQFVLFRLLDEGLTGTRLKPTTLADHRFLKYLPLVIQEDKGGIIAVRLKGSEDPRSKEYVP